MAKRVLHEAPAIIRPKGWLSNSDFSDALNWFHYAFGGAVAGLNSAFQHSRGPLQWRVPEFYVESPPPSR